ncbi:TPA: BRO-N domain-containing protein [Morganella morganii]|uniref:BRO-N domain-containing protein n=1 Tax=Morganella sp. Je.2.23 TaxID=3142840 RepID=UPI003DA8594E
MNSVAKTDLTFQKFTFNPVTENGQVWLTSAELARALEYSSSKSISTLYSRNEDEFTPAMTQVIEVMTSGNYRKRIRIFSLRGAHLLAMFAKTEVAKLFRKWVLDILDHQPVRDLKAKSPTQREIDAHNINSLAGHYEFFYSAWKEEIYPALKLLGSPLAGRLSDRFQDGNAFVTRLKQDINRRLSAGEKPWIELK